MNRTKYKWLSLTIAVLLLLSLFAGCGASAPMEAASADTAAGAMVEAPAEEALAFDAVAEESAAVEAATEEETTTLTNETDFTEKIIYAGYLYVETTEFDTGIAALDAMVQEFDGFLESSDISGHTTANADGTTRVIDRYACYVIRVPCDRFPDFMSQAGTIGNVVNTSKTAQNITSQFTDSEAYLDSLTLQEERLLAMMEQATDVETLVTLEARLSDVRYEIDATTRQLNNWQQQVDYSTVTINLQEVSVYTPTAATTRTFGERIADAFTDGWQSFGSALENLAVGLVEIWPVLLLLAVIAIGIVWLVKRSHRKAAQRRAAFYQAQQNPQNQPPQEPQEPKE